MHRKWFSFLSGLTALVMVLSMAFGMPSVAFAEGDVPEEPTPEETEAATDTTEDTGSTEEAESTEITEEAVVETETIADVIEVLDETDSVLVDEAGLPMVAAEAETAELLAVADPWFEDPGDPTSVIAYQSDCTGWAPPAGYAGGVCNVSATLIKDAVNAAPVGGTVRIEAGEFTEQVEINKNLTLQGSAGAIIKSPTALVDSFATPGNNNYPVIYVHDADNVNITGLTIDGDNQGNSNYRFVGVGYYNAGGSITNNTITNIMNSSFSGAQHGVGIYVYSDDGNPHVIVIDDNVVEDYQKTGIAVIGDEIDATITNNTVTGQGPTSVTAQNGIQVGSGDITAVVSGNTVTGNYYTGPTWTASGILLQVGPDVEMSNNQLSGNQSAVYIYDANATMDGDTIDDSQYSIIVFGDSAGASAAITNADISNSEIGVYVYGSVDGNTPVSVDNSDLTGHDYGIYTNQSDTTINNSNIVGNGFGVYSDAAGSIDATYNYWGCWTGVGGVGCDGNFGNVNTVPYLTVANPGVDTDLDGIEDGADNCPDVANANQRDRDDDGEGDVCDAYPNDPENERPGRPQVPQTITQGGGGLIIPVTGGGVFFQNDSVVLAVSAGDGATIVVTPFEEIPTEIYGVAVENVTAAVQLDIPAELSSSTVTIVFNALEEQVIFAILPDGTTMELPTTCVPAAGGGFSCSATYTPSGTEDSLHPVIYLQGN